MNDLDKKQTAIANAVSAITITDDATMQSAAEVRAKIGATLKQAIAEKEKLTAPLNATLKEIRARYKPLEVACEQGMERIDASIKAYRLRIAEEARIKEERIAKRVEKGTMRVDTAITKMGQIEKTEKTVGTDNGALQFRTVKVLVIDDEQSIPREFLVVDRKAVETALRAGRVVPGAHLQEEEQIAQYGK